MKVECQRCGKVQSGNLIIGRCTRKLLMIERSGWQHRVECGGELQPIGATTGKPPGKEPTSADTEG